MTTHVPGFVRALSGVALFVATLLTGTVHASGPVESFARLAPHPTDSQQLVLFYSNGVSRTGLLYSDDAGQSFRLVCTAAMAKHAVSLPSDRTLEQADSLRGSAERARFVHFAGDGHVLLGFSEGLLVGDGEGCGWASEPSLEGLWISGIAAHPTEPGVSYVVTNGGTEDAREGLARRRADGSFSLLSPAPLAPDGELWSVAGLFAAPRGAGDVRLYLVSLRYNEMTLVLQTIVMVSDDEGAHWAEYPVDTPEGTSFYLAAVDPTDPLRVVGYLSRSDDGNDWEKERDTLLVSRDGGATFEPYFDVSEVGEILFADDGTLWIADAGKSTTTALPVGLHRAAPGLNAEPEKVFDEAVTCLGTTDDDDRLFACTVFEFGVIEPSSSRFEELVSVWTVSAFVDCPSQDVVSDCRDQMCESGWCGPGHHARAPVCAAYDEPFCGNHVDDWGNSDDGGVMNPPGSDAGSDAGVVQPANDSGPGPTPEEDGGTDPPKKTKDRCSLTAGISDAGPGVLWWVIALCAFCLRRRAAAGRPRRV